MFNFAYTIAFWVGLVIGCFFSLLAMTAGCMYCLARFSSILTAAIAEDAQAQRGGSTLPEAVSARQKRLATPYGEEMAALAMDEEVRASVARISPVVRGRRSADRITAKAAIKASSCGTCAKIRAYFKGLKKA